MGDEVCITSKSLWAASNWISFLLQEITGDGQLATMRVVPVEQIVQHTVSESANDCYEPAIDRRGFVKPMSSMEALVSGKFHKVPVLLGVTENDGLGKSELEQTIFRSSDVRTRAELEKLLQLEFGENAQHVLEHYWQKDVESDAKAVHKSLSLLSNDLWYFAGTYHMAQLISCSSPVFLYCFAGAKRSMHGSDMASWRGNAKSNLSQIMSQYLGNFARYGNLQLQSIQLLRCHPWDRRATPIYPIRSTDHCGSDRGPPFCIGIPVECHRATSGHCGCQKVAGALGTFAILGLVECGISRAQYPHCILLQLHW